MTKPLELTVYPKLERSRPGEDGFWDWREQFLRERRAVVDKRFTDTELAAEHWAALVDVDTEERYFRRDASHLKEQFSTICRFATLPHHDEDAS